MRALLLSLALALAAPAHAQIFGPATPMLLGDGGAVAPSFAFAAEPVTGIYRASGGQLGLTSQGAGVMGLNGQQVLMASGVTLGWEPSGLYIAPADVLLARDAANVFAQRNGTNAQTFRIYNTFTDASNYERVSLGWSGNVFSIKPEAAGTGTVRTVSITGAPRVLAKAIATNATPLYSSTADLNENTALTISIPANTIGATGALRLSMHWTTNAAASAKTVRIKLGGTQLVPDINIGQTVAESETVALIINRTTGAQNGVANIVFGTFSSAFRGTDGAVDTTASQNLTVTLQQAAATAGASLLQSYVLELLP